MDSSISNRNPINLIIFNSFISKKRVIDENLPLSRINQLDNIKNYYITKNSVIPINLPVPIEMNNDSDKLIEIINSKFKYQIIEIMDTKYFKIHEFLGNTKKRFIFVELEKKLTQSELKILDDRLNEKRLRKIVLILSIETANATTSRRIKFNHKIQPNEKLRKIIFMIYMYINNPDDYKNICKILNEIENTLKIVHFVKCNADKIKIENIRKKCNLNTNYYIICNKNENWYANNSSIIIEYDKHNQKTFEDQIKLLIKFSRN